MKATRVLSIGLLAIFAGAVVPFAAGQNGNVLPPGPWGRVELAAVQIRLPASMVPDGALPVQPWFVEMGRDDTARFLGEAGVEPGLAEQLLATYDPSHGGALHPTATMIRALDPVPRARLYEALRAVVANGPQRSAHRFRRARLAERFRDLAPTTVDLVREFLYERESLPQSWLLADLAAVMQLIDDPVERARLIQAVSQQDSMLLRLTLDTTSNPAELAEYWGRGGRRRDLEILLSSLIDYREPRRIDVIYLLPPFARAYLLTYPRLENAASRDCFWTSLNFFLPAPDDGLVGARLANTMVADYTRVEGAPRFGDMLVLWRPSGEAEHAAIYIAGDLYFTKNGNNIAMPWLLMDLTEILDRYDEAERSPLTHYRLKNLD